MTFYETVCDSCGYLNIVRSDDEPLVIATTCDWCDHVYSIVAPIECSYQVREFRDGSRVLYVRGD